MNKIHVQVAILVDTDQVNLEDIPSLIKRRVPGTSEVYLEWVDGYGDYFKWEETER